MVCDYTPSKNSMESPLASVTMAFFQEGATAKEPADAAILAAHDLGVDATHADVEQPLDGVANLDLVGVAGDLEQNLLLELFGVFGGGTSCRRSRGAWRSSR